MIVNCHLDYPDRVNDQFSHDESVEKYVMMNRVKVQNFFSKCRTDTIQIISKENSESILKLFGYYLVSLTKLTVPLSMNLEYNIPTTVGFNLKN